MSNLLENRISVPVDYTNPGQFFACCGLLELADRIWPGAEGWFEVGEFRIAAAPGASLQALLEFAKHAQFELDGGGKAGDDEDGPVIPILINLPVRGAGPAELLLNWWSDRATKPWAGSMNERDILNAMLRAIDPANSDPFNDGKVAYDPGGGSKKKPQKREPFYFDCRRSSNAHPLDSGFSPDTAEFESECFPAVEGLCFIGLQRARPAPTGRPRESRYVVWTEPLPLGALGPVVCGLAEIRGSLSFTFENVFRTHQRRLKSFSRARRERSRNV